MEKKLLEQEGPKKFKAYYVAVLEMEIDDEGIDEQNEDEYLYEVAMNGLNKINEETDGKMSFTIPEIEQIRMSDEDGKEVFSLY